jgi:hypothetical protein
MGTDLVPQMPDNLHILMRLSALKISIELKTVLSTAAKMKNKTYDSYIMHSFVFICVGLRSLACCDRGFEFHQRHECLSVVCCVLSGRVLCDELITRQRGVLPNVARRCVCSRKLVWRGGHSPRWDALPEKIINNLYLFSKIFHTKSQIQTINPPLIQKRDSFIMWKEVASLLFYYFSVFFPIMLFEKTHYRLG